MNFDVHAAALVLAMAFFTWLLRFLPFLVFRKNTPGYIVYLGKVLPSAIIIKCLRRMRLCLIQTAGASQ